MAEENKPKTSKKDAAKKIAKDALNKTSIFGKEFKKQTSTAIMAAFGLVIALSWREVVMDLVNKIGFPESYGLIITAIVVTAFSVLGIFLVSKWASSGSKGDK